jgi:hypothetical protein
MVGQEWPTYSIRITVGPRPIRNHGGMTAKSGVAELRPSMMAVKKGGSRFASFFFVLLLWMKSLRL